MIFPILNNHSFAMILGLPMRYKAVILLSSVFILIFFIGNAWSYERDGISKESNVSRETLVKSSYPLIVTDVCNSLLKYNHQNPPHGITVKSQRTAGKIAALGIILGARFALEPKNSNITLNKNTVTKHYNKSKDGNRSAQTIAAFRKCQKEQILSKVALMN